ncbi:hypothetical protein [Gelidibacter japonicus]|uniref:hypothetical protein n=1 Tax=Gelidibacter japonicus TaxID=1962232 RepID=UPI002AFE71F3|nr:hypothetical protein [Gelidibacter japonicus]
MGIKNKIANNLKNIIGKSVKQRYLIIESDDWGSIRMPSVEAYDRLKSKNLNVGKGEGARYNQTDTLASSEDFEMLFDVLKKHKDHLGNPMVFTAVSVVANPDFAKIEDSKFKEYHFEPFTETLKRYNRESAIEFWKHGIEENLFHPEFHGREHLNTQVWLRMLQKNDEHTLAAFKEGCWGINADKTPFGINYQAAFDLESKNDLPLQEESIVSGLQLFETIHGYKAEFFVPPNGPFNNNLEKATKVGGIKYIGASKVQLEPQGEGRVKKRYHYLGQKNKHGQTYLTRNAFFEPNAPGKDWVSSCLNDIHYAFKWNKPAVISSHRTNYIGALNIDNRKLGLEKLDNLLTEVLKRWPDVEFITSSELGKKISG